MDLKALRYFEFVAELRSFSKAAIHLHVAQPALSRQVQKLEDELGVELFRRNGRGIELTEAGSVALAKARLIRQQVTDLSVAVAARGRDITARIVLGAPPVIGDLVIPYVIQEAEALYPQLAIDFVEGSSVQLLDRVLAREISLCLGHNPRSHRDLKVTRIAPAHLYLVGPAKPTCGLQPVTKELGLSGLPMILPYAPNNRRLIIDRYCALNGIELDVRHHVEGFTNILAMIEAGMGYSILSYFSISQMLQSNRLSASPIDDPQMRTELAITYRKDFPEPNHVRPVLDLIKKRLSDLYDKSGIPRG